MKLLKIPDAFMTSIRAHAEREYPRECCGIGTGPDGPPSGLTHLYECRNAAEDAPRAYRIDPRDLLQIHKDLRIRRETVRLVYHSHPDASAEFSQEDERQALFEGEPLYPAADHLIYEVRKGRAVSWTIFRWDRVRKKFLSTARQTL